MNKYKIIIQPSFEKNFIKLDNSTKKRVYKFFKKLESSDNPQAFGKSLTGKFKNHFRYRIDNFRIIAKINNNELIILVLDIDKREIVYEK